MNRIQKVNDKLYTKEVFILTDEWFERNGKIILRFLCITPGREVIEWRVTNQRPFFFVPSEAKTELSGITFLRRKVGFRSFEKSPLDILYFHSQGDLLKADEILRRRGIQTFESDVNPVRRFLMEKGINISAKITVQKPDTANGMTVFTDPEIEKSDFTPDLVKASIDIETGNKNRELYSVAFHITGFNRNLKKVFMRGGGKEANSGHTEYCPDEKCLIKKTAEFIARNDPDLVIGWNVDGFDLWFLDKRSGELNIPFNIGRGGRKITLKERRSGGIYVFIPGRIVIDGPMTLRGAFYNFEDFTLETVANELLGRGKLITPGENKVAEIERRFREDKEALAKYNLEDAELVTEIFDKTGIVELNIKRAKMSGLALDQTGAMTAAFDHFFLPLLHKEKYAAPNVADLKTGDHAAGGYVFDSVPGIYEHVVVLDFKSLYPSLIMTFKIDPLSRLENNIEGIMTPPGYSFSSKKHYLPGFIEELMAKRAEAKRTGDRYLSQAIKILMNSFYGVMGSFGCRFYHPDLPNAITGTGQWLLLECRGFLEELGYLTIYGDTDSLFVKLNSEDIAEAENKGIELASEINEYIRVY